MMNPAAASLLVPLAPGGALGNLFEILATAVPDLAARVADYTPDYGIIVEALRLSPERAGTRSDDRQTLQLSVVKLDAQTVMASVSDVTAEVERERLRVTAMLDRAARTDSLTAMPNRAVMLELIARAIREGVEVSSTAALLFINCDRFKGINDAYGRGAGDELLRLMANRLTGAVRPGDAVASALVPGGSAARLGGDEFVLLIERLVHRDDAATVAERLLEVLGRPYTIAGQQIRASVSIGVVRLPGAGAAASADSAESQADQVLQDASIAMHDAKGQGGGRISHFAVAMRERVARRFMVENELRDALQNDELSVFYQPIVSLDDPCVVEMEALVRWRHPGRGMILPVEFIPIAEETGLIVALGKCVLDAACRQFMVWQSSLGPRAPKTMSVNVSRAQLADPQFVAHVADLLEVLGMRADQLQLEITESLAAEPEHVTPLHSLKQLGVVLALDDFGTGYSSLSSLHLMPVDVIKIDRSFVQEAENSAHHRVLIEATVRVARSLGMRTVAEGIETSAELSVVGQLLCEKAQGYYFSKPMSGDRATEWLIDRVRQAETAELPLAQ
jgi:diguanylate cyclase (GGDEF)-like protein